MNHSSRSLVKIVVLLCSVLIRLIAGDNKFHSNSLQVIASHCSDKCGKVTIPYPFGIEEGCYYKERHTLYSSFQIQCNNSTNPPTPSLNFGGFGVWDISVVEGEIRTRTYASAECYNESGFKNATDEGWFYFNTFTISRSKNLLIAIGCDTISTFTGLRGDKEFETGCITKCVDPEDVIDGECNGIGCCQASIPDGIRNVTYNVNSDNNHSSVYQFNPCGVAFTIAKDAFKFDRTSLSRKFEFYNKMSVPAVISWTITGQGNCSRAKTKGKLLCGRNAGCYDPEHEEGYRCKCNFGYAGNPYLPLGCKDIDECTEVNNCEKPEYCFNTIGGHYCKCPKGYYGNGTITDPCVLNLKHRLIPALATAGCYCRECRM